MTFIHSRTESPNRLRGRFLAASMLAGSAWLLGIGLDRLGVPLLAALLSWPVFLLPGLFVALTIEQLTRQSERPAVLCLWTIVFSFTVTPAATYVIGTMIGDASPILYPLLPFCTWWLISVLVLFLVQVIQRGQTGVLDLHLKREVVVEYALLAAAFLGIMLLNFLLYPFIPEADSYGYLITLDRAALDPAILLKETRLLFVMLVSLVAQILSLDPYWVLKVVLPLAYMIPVATIALIARPLLPSATLRSVAALSPLFFPVILQEALVSRPQTIVVILLLPVLVLISHITTRRYGLRQLYWLIALLAVSFLGLKIHTLFFVVGVLTVLAFGRIAWPVARKQPLDTALIVLGIGILLIPWIPAARIVSDLWHLVRLFWYSFRENEFVFWFIDQYRNVDGVEAGWPGWTALLYYGYNLGVFLPVVLMTVLSAGVHSFRRMFQSQYWPSFVLIGFFFFIAEFMPRFQLAYLPDRAWLFCVLAITVLIPQLLVSATTARQSWATRIVFLAAIVSLVAATGVTYAKQGWITRAEFAAASFIKNETPANAIFLGQGSGRVLVRYFSERIFIVPPASVFLEDDPSAVDRYLTEQQVLKELAIQGRVEYHETVADRLAALVQDFRSQHGLTEGRDLIEALSLAVSQGELALYDEAAIQQQYPVIDPAVPLFIMYADDKFNSLYGQRGWWRASNFYGANTAKFTERYPLVYDHENVKIWKVR